jgi:curved DNA-binding protein CbpA
MSHQHNHDSTMVGVAEQDHYAMLGIDVNASFAEIKHACRQLIRTSHPDKFANALTSVRSGAEEHTKCLNGANEALSDPVTRAAYDRTYLQHIKTQHAQASKSTPQPAWPQASTYTPCPKPPFNSCFIFRISRKSYRTLLTLTSCLRSSLVVLHGHQSVLNHEGDPNHQRVLNHRSVPNHQSETPKT